MTPGKTISFKVEGMHCQACALTIEKALSNLSGVLDIRVNFGAARAKICYLESDSSLKVICEKLSDLGYSVITELFELRIKDLRENFSRSGLEKNLLSIPGIIEVRTDLLSKTAIVRSLVGEIDVVDLYTAVKASGYKSENTVINPYEGEEIPKEFRERWNRFWLGVILTGPVLIISMARDFGVLTPFLEKGWVDWLLFLLATPVQLYVGLGFYVGAVRAIKNYSLNMDVLVVLGSSTAYFFSLAVLMAKSSGTIALGEHTYFETAVMIITLVKLGKFLEERAKNKTKRALSDLFELKPDTASVKRKGSFIEVLTNDVKEGELVMVRPGEKVPVDGRIVRGSTAVDESLLTGESLPIAKGLGATVIAGAVNLSSLIEFKVTAIGSKTRLSQIIRLMEEIQEGNAKTQKLVDRISSIFIPVVLIVALGSFLFWVLLSNQGFTQGVLRMISVLVIACPCSLGLATPTAIMVGTGIAARKGILFKSVTALELGNSIKSIVFDKTGTLSFGKPSISDIVTTNLEKSRFSSNKLERHLLKVAASVGYGSEHPLATAIVDEANQRGINIIEVENFCSVPGLGATCNCEKDVWRIGNSNFMLNSEVDLASLESQKNRHEQEGKRTVWVSCNKEAIGLIAVFDKIRTEARSDVKTLQKKGLKVIMMSGDHQVAVASVARDLGISEYKSHLTPEKKAAEILELQLSGSIVAMAGDGINDAPGLAQADLGIALGSGADLATQTADIIIMGNKLDLIPLSLAISERTIRTIRQNISWAFLYNLILIPTAAGALYNLESLPHFIRGLHPAMAALAMAFSSISVVLNSLRQKYFFKNNHK